MLEFASFVRQNGPFPHWVSRTALSQDIIHRINEEWPAADDLRWYVEVAGYVRKSALMFPLALPPTANVVAEVLYSEECVTKIAEMISLPGLLPDPWFKEGPASPRVGGGLHEIGYGGLLNMHVDFDAHPTGLTRAVNLLIYLNEDWDDAWGGKLELHSAEFATSYAPRAGTAVLFPTNGRSWHGHPEPLQCPRDRARRSLALYYYVKSDVKPERKSTVYRIV